MSDIIQLLPDAIANQIAAGEVIQRPASVVKELMENAIDAGASGIKVIIKDAGRTLIQIIDDGCGMSETDARLSFERHATSKIRKADDLFAIRTMGFRGEALASIAAVAQVEMRTRRKADELGTRIAIEGSELKAQEPCQTAPGTSIAVKNLFFNVPARRNFLKSNTVEMRHILDEFERIAAANPDLFFSLHHNNQEVLHLPTGNLRQRVTGLLGNNSNKKLVPIHEEADMIRIQGFVGRPEFAKKTRGEQWFFVNKRFIRNSYLNHAVLGAYEDLLPQDAFPLYLIFIDIDPARIDINVHPTKQEIKFEDERLVYNYLKVAVRHALGQHSIMPSLDFDQEVNFAPVRMPPQIRREPTIERITKSQAFPSPDRLKEVNLRNWEKLYEELQESEPEASAPSPAPVPLTIESSWAEDEAGEETGGAPAKPQQQRAPYQVHASYIVSHIKSGFLLIDQQAAHERILYEKYLDMLRRQTSYTQQQLFPRTLPLPPADAMLLREILPDINRLGFDVQEFGLNTFVINGVPAELAGKQDEVSLLESLLEQYKSNVELRLDIRENISRSMAKSASIRRGQALSTEEMQALIDRLFACEMPYQSPTGRQCFLTFELDELDKRFQKN